PPRSPPAVKQPRVPAMPAPASAAVPAGHEQPAVAQSHPEVQVAEAKPPVVAAATPATALAPARVGEVWRGKFETGKLFAVILVLAGIGVIGWGVVFWGWLRGTHLSRSRRGASGPSPQLAGMEYAAAAAGEMKVMPRLIGSPRQISLKLKASEPLRRRAVVPLSKPSRVFGGGMVAEPAAVDGNCEHQLELEPVAEAFESVEPVVEQEGALEPELSAVETPEPVFTEPEEIHVAEIEPVFAKAPEAVSEAVFEPEMEPVGQGQPIPQLTPVEE